MLEISAIQYNDVTPVFPIVCQLPQEGGSIGRANDNAVVLPDPMRLLSRRHLLIEPQSQETYLLTNISTSNPAMLNDAVLGPGKSSVLNHDDQIRIGGYLLRARIKANADPQAGGHPADGHPAHTAAGITAILDQSSTRPLMTDDLLGIAAITPEIGLPDLAQDSGRLLAGLGSEPHSQPLAHELTRDPLTQTGNSLLEEGALDPLALFGGEDTHLDVLAPSASVHTVSSDTPLSRPGSQLHTPFLLDALKSGTTSLAAELAVSDSPVMQNAYPQSQSRAGYAQSPTGNTHLIPEELALDELIGGLDSPTITTDAPIQENTGNQENPLSHDDLAHDHEHVVSPIPAPPAEHPGEEGQGRAVTGADAIENEALNLDLSALHAALLEGLGLDDVPEQRTLDAEFMRALGVLLRTAIDGTVQLMAARATVKREVRANMTIISPERNNPLKFSPDAEVALRYLLGRQYPGFMSAEDAVREAFADLLQHQLGVVAGMRSALFLVLERFDPETMTHDVGTGGMLDNLLPMRRKARLWDAYARYFESAKEQAADRFHAFFGAAFVDAYEETARTRTEHTSGGA